MNLSIKYLPLASFSPFLWRNAPELTSCFSSSKTPATEATLFKKKKANLDNQCLKWIWTVHIVVITQTTIIKPFWTPQIQILTSKEKIWSSYSRQSCTSVWTVLFNFCSLKQQNLVFLAALFQSSNEITRLLHHYNTTEWTNNQHYLNLVPF